MLRRSPFGQALNGVRAQRGPRRAARLQRQGCTSSRCSPSPAPSAASPARCSASLMQFVNPQGLHWGTSGDVVIMTLLGGSARCSGRSSASSAFEALKELISSLDRALVRHPRRHLHPGDDVHAARHPRRAARSGPACGCVRQAARDERSAPDSPCAASTSRCASARFDARSTTSASLSPAAASTAYRPERRRQDDADQRAVGTPAAERRARVLWTGATSPPAGLRARRAPGHRPQLPDHQDLRRHVGVREPAPRRAGAACSGCQPFWRPVERYRGARATRPTPCADEIGLAAPARRARPSSCRTATSARSSSASR